MNWLPAVVLGVLVVCVVVAVGVAAYRSGRRAGKASAYDEVATVLKATGKKFADQPTGLPGRRVTTADLNRPARMYEMDD